VCVCFSAVPSSSSSAPRPVLNHQVVVDQVPVIDQRPVLDHRPVVDVGAENVADRNTAATNGVLEHVEVKLLNMYYVHILYVIF